MSLTSPLADPVLARRLAGVQTLCLAVMTGLAGVAFGVSLVVGYALDWQPLAGNAVTVGGVSAATVVAAGLTLFVPPVAVAVGRWKRAAELRAVAAAHPEIAGTEEEADRLMAAFAGATFAEYAVAAGTGIAWTVLFHLTSDWRTLVLVGALLAFLVARYPTTRRTARWLEEGRAEVGRQRRPA
ncbi:MAG: hypothetical protein U0871_14590 [Gemmataceae bacterium]